MTSLRRVTALVTGVAMLVVGVAAAASSAGTAGCPARQRPAGSGLPAAARELVPPGASDVLLCRYHFNRLAGHGLIARQSAIGTLTRRFNALRPMPPGVYHCPADFGVFVTADFSYAASGRDTVQVDEGGCTPVSNGRLDRWAGYPPGPRLLRQLLTYTGCPSGRRPEACG